MDKHRNRFRRSVLPQLLPISLLGIVGSLIFFAAAYQLERQGTEAKFRELAEQRLVAVKSNIGLTIDIVNMLAGHFAVTPEGATSRQGFAGMLAPLLRRHNFVQGLSWNPKLLPGDLSRYERMAAEDGLADFKITERDSSGKPSPVQPRDEYVPIYFMEPIDTNRAALGFDLASNPVRKAALDAARDSGSPRVTGRITLVQEQGDQYGVLILAPVYGKGAADDVEGRRANLTGYVSGVYRIGDLISSSVMGSSAASQSLVEVHLFDLSAPDDSQLLYPKSSGRTIAALESDIHIGQQISMAGRKWLMVASPGAQFRASNMPYVSIGVLIIALLATAFYLFYLRGRILATEEALFNARQVNDAQQKLRLAQKIARIGSIEIDRADGSCFVSEGAAAVLRLDVGDANLSFEEAFRNVAPEDRDLVATNLMPHGNKAVSFEFHIGVGDTIRTIFAQSDENAGEGAGFVVVTLQDVTSRRAAEQERATMIQRMAESGRLEALGTLAGGVAHEINTPIQYIGDNLRFLRDGVSDLVATVKSYRAAAEGKAGFEQALQKDKEVDVEFLAGELPMAATQGLDGVDRIAKIVQSIKAFSHPGSLDVGRFDLNATITNAATVSRNQWKYAAELTMDLDPDLRPILGIQNEISQVVLNLVLNAAHAIEEAKPAEGGKIKVTTKCEGPNVVLTISDNGTGIPKAIRDRIFDLFFTTKAPGKGTGQGLSISKSIIVKNHGGQMDVESTPGKGAKFIIRLPIDGK